MSERQRYQVIYADPPWPEDPSAIKTKTAHAHRHFRTMPFGKLSGLRVSELADDAQSVIFLWTTFRHMPLAVSLIGAWGFRYKREGFVWVKTKTDGQPIYSLAFDTGACAEVCLLGTRGKRIVPSKRMVGSVVLSGRGKLAKKPGEVRRRIEEMYPWARKLELFARERAPGWTCLGDELDGYDMDESIRRLL